MLADVTQWAIEIVYSFGYIGLFFLTALGNMNMLIPTQLTLPLAGFLVGQGRFLLVSVLTASTAGSVAASLLLYALGLWSGESLRQRVGRIDKRFNKLVFKPNLDAAGKLFERHGRKAILLGRFVPGTGAPISVLAGIKRMPIWQFTVYTTFGSALWNGAFIGLGWEFGAQWPLVKQYASIIEYMVLAAVAVGGLLWILWRRWKMYD